MRARSGASTRRVTLVVCFSATPDRPWSGLLSLMIASLPLYHHHMVLLMMLPPS